METLKIIYYVLLMGSLVTLLLNSRKLPVYTSWLIPVIVLGLFIQALSDFLEARKVSSYFLFHLYQPVEYFLLLGFYYSIIQRSKWIIISSAVLYIILLAAHYIVSPQLFYKGDFLDFTVEAIIICILIIVFFLQILKNEQRIVLKYFTAFWINAAHLIFYGGCLFVMGFYYYLRSTDLILARNLLGINHILNLFLYTAYILIFICTAAEKK